MGQWKAFLGMQYPRISLGNKLSSPHSPSPLISFRSEGCWVLLGPLLSSRPVICSPRGRLLFPFFSQAPWDRVTLDGEVCQVTAPVTVTHFPFPAKSIRGNISPSSLWTKIKKLKLMVWRFACAKTGKQTTLAVFMCVLMCMALPVSQMERKPEKERRESS